MTEQTAHYPARCDGCNHAYRVPRLDRTYPCKRCGGAIRATPGSEREERKEPAKGSVTCSECEAINPGGMHFCVECGTTLEESEAAPGSDEALRLRQEANEALKSAYRSITFVTIMYRLGAFAYAVATVFAVLALARTDVPREGGVLVVVLTTVLAVLLLLGALNILFNPFVWTLAIAVVATAVSVVHLIGPDPLGVALLGSAAWAALAWGALVPMLRFKKLIARHKDLYILHHASAKTRRSLKGRSAHERHRRLVDSMHRAAQRAKKVSFTEAAAICLASIAGTYAVLTTMRPEELPPKIERFEAAWNRADFTAAGELFDPDHRKTQTARLLGLVDGLGWDDSAPELAEGQREDGGDETSVRYEIDGGTVTAHWMLLGTEWSLVRLDLPVPPLEPTIQRFVAAWKSSKPATVAGFFSADARSRMTEVIQDAKRKRGWTSLPDILETRVGDYAGGEGFATLFLEQGPVTTQWKLRSDDGKWGLVTLRLPKN